MHNDLLIRQKCEAMIAYGHIAVRQFPKMGYPDFPVDEVKNRA